MKYLACFVMAMALMRPAAPLAAKVFEQAKKEKQLHNQYTVEDGDKLVINNQYGTVHVNTWDKNEVTVDIVVTVKARRESDAQEVMDGISFDIFAGEGSHMVSYRTIVHGGGNNVEMTIDYTINAPRRNPVDITDKFGNVFIGDLSGRADMNVSYGALTMQSVTGSNNHIKVAFGSAAISSLQTGDVNVSYSNTSIDNAGDIVVTNKFGKLDLGDVNHLRLDQHYGNVDIRSVKQLEGEVYYADLAIGDLGKKLTLTLKYSGNASIRNIGPGVDYVNVDAFYSDLHYNFAEGANLSISATAAFGSLKADIPGQSFEVDHHSVGFMGKVGNGDGHMTIAAHYTNVYLR